MVGPRILVIEDEPDISGMLQFYLESEGFEVELIITGAEAMDRLATDPPALVILDYMLPHHNGLTILRQLRETAAWVKTPVIMLTAKSSEHDQVAGFDAGADDYVVKPFQLDSLVARVQRLLKGA
ncbi:MAG TPA: response regulator [Acidimicrobiia bacterium]|nr:response regulator [Acidimicrobiia bacterium]